MSTEKGTTPNDGLEKLAKTLNIDAGAFITSENDGLDLTNPKNVNLILEGVGNLKTSLNESAEEKRRKDVEQQRNKAFKEASLKADKEFAERFNLSQELERDALFEEISKLSKKEGKTTQDDWLNSSEGQNYLKTYAEKVKKEAITPIQQELENQKLQYSNHIAQSVRDSYINSTLSEMNNKYEGVDDDLTKAWLVSKLEKGNYMHREGKYILTDEEGNPKRDANEHVQYFSSVIEKELMPKFKPKQEINSLQTPQNRKGESIPLPDIETEEDFIKEVAKLKAFPEKQRELKEIFTAKMKASAQQ